MLFCVLLLYAFASAGIREDFSAGRYKEVEESLLKPHTEKYTGEKSEYFAWLNFANGNFKGAFENWRDYCLISSGSSPKQALLENLCTLRFFSGFINDRKLVRDVYVLLAGKIRDPEAGRMLAENLFEFSMAAGDTDSAPRYLAETGRISEWQIAGPYTHFRRYDLAEIFAPETTARTGKWWKPVKTPDMSIPFGAALYPGDPPVVGYARTFFSVPARAECLLIFETRDSLRVWLDGDEIYSRNACLGTPGSSGTVRRKLAAGWHEILLKGQRLSYGREWSVGVSLCTANFKPFTAKFSTEPPEGFSFKPLRNTADFSAGNAEKTVSAPAGKIPTLRMAVSAVNELENSNFLQALAIANNARQQEPANPLLLFLQGFFFLQYQDSPQARNCFRQTLEIYPGFVPAAGFLAGTFINEEKYKEAQEALEEIRKSRGSNPFIDYLLARVYYFRNWPIEFSELLGSASAADPANPEILELMADIAEKNMEYGTSESLRRQALKLNLNRTTSWQNLVGFLVRQKKKNEAVEVYNSWLQFDPHAQEGELNIRKAELLIETGEFEEARKTVEADLKVCPGYPHAFEMLGRIEFLQGNREGAVKFWTKSLELKPDNFELKKKLLCLTNQPDLSSTQTEDFRPIVRSEPGTDFPKAAAVRCLEKQTVRLVDDDKAFEEANQIIVRILNKKGRENWEQVYLGNYSEEVMEARTIKQDNRLFDAIPVPQVGLTPVSLDDGNFLEYNYSTDTPSSFFELAGFYSGPVLFRQAEDAVLRKEFTLIAPAGRKINVSASKNLEYDEKTENNLQARTWKAKNLQPIDPECFMPPMERCSPFLYISTIDSWLEVAKSLRGSLWGLALPDFALKEKTAHVIGNARTLTDKARKIFRFVADEIEPGKSQSLLDRPKPSNRILFNRQAGEEEKIGLLKSMLSEIGVAAEIVFSGQNNSEFLPENSPNLQYFSHPLLHVLNLEGREIWLDPSTKYAPFGKLFSALRKVHIINPSTGNISTMPDLPSYFYRSVDKVNISLDEEAKIRGDIEFRLSGDLAVGIRNKTDEPGVKNMLLSSVFNEIISGIQIDNPEMSGEKDPESDLVMKTGFSGGNLARKESGGMLSISATVEPLELTKNYQLKEKREFALFDNMPQRTETEVVITLPDGFSVASLPAPLDIKSKYIDYSIAFDTADNKLTIHRKFEKFLLDIQPEEYPEFVKICQKIDQFEKKRLTFLK